MKLLVFILLCFFCISVKGQTSDFEIKVVSKKYQTVRGVLKKVSAEGIGVEDYKGNYLTFRPSEITRLKIRKRGLTVGEATGGGAVGGLGIGLLLMSLESEDSQNGDDLLKLTAALTAGGAGIGVIVGIIAEISNTKYILKVNENYEKYKAGYKNLDKYINTVVSHHIN
ncbi:hypothetical protein [Pedobacter frigiditerrae]|uniref:hypothetical protein n=1 Tax=Pedobacter frigiditerrae TaxID=2530452 RepID=UPI00292D9DB0|nr:hypothetical protein [Pedobacter frigiditerrae]